MPRPLSQQVVVITGASTGIGRASAVEFAKHGAAVVLAARNEAALQEVAGEIKSAGGRVHVVLTDVAEADQVEHLADEAIREFGRIDTWVNNAGFGHAAHVEDMKAEEITRLMQVNVCGLIFGTKAAITRMKPQGGGTIINLGSVVSVRGIPIQSVYCASKHAIKGFTEAVRLEQERQKSGITFTLICPAVINTPFYNHAKSDTGKKLTPFDPIYPPEVVAESIVFAAENPRREIFVGGYGKLLDIMQRISPKLVDFQLLQIDDAEAKLQADGPQEEGMDNMFTPAHDRGPVHGGYDDRSLSGSIYTKTFEWYPILKPIALGSAALGAFAVIRALTANPHPYTRAARGTGQKLAQTTKATAKTARAKAKGWF